MAEQKFMVTDPHCATKGGDIVARNFKTEANARRWLDRKALADPDGYAGCIVEPMPSDGVTVVQPQQEAELDAEIDKAWQQWSVAGNVMYRQGFINAVNSLARDADGVPVLGESQQQEKTK